MEKFPRLINKNNNEGRNNLEEDFTGEIAKTQTNAEEINSIIKEKKGVISLQAKEKLVKVAKVMAYAGIITGALFATVNMGIGATEVVQSGGPINTDPETMNLLFANMGIGVATLIAGTLATLKLDTISENIRNKFKPKTATV